MALTTAQVIARCGISRRSLEKLLEQQPDLRPAGTFAGAFAWTEGEAAKVVLVFETRKKARDQAAGKAK